MGPQVGPGAEGLNVALSLISWLAECAAGLKRLEKALVGSPQTGPVA